MAGIVGRSRYQFDIWGDTVNSAARMQSEAQPGTLCVNAATRELLTEDFPTELLGHREIKGKGPQEVFIARGAKRDG